MRVDQPWLSLRDRLWPVVNVPCAVQLVIACGRIRAGSIGTLRWFGNKNATIEFDDSQLPYRASVAISSIVVLSEITRRAA